MVSLGNRSNVVCWWTGRSGKAYSYQSFAFVRTISATQPIASVALVVKAIVTGEPATRRGGPMATRSAARQNLDEEHARSRYGRRLTPDAYATSRSQ
jgi:hypothetical protein